MVFGTDYWNMWEKGEIIEREEGISGCPLVKVYNELIKGAGGMPLQEFIILLIVLLTSSLYEG